MRAAQIEMNHTMRTDPDLQRRGFHRSDVRISSVSQSDSQGFALGMVSKGETS